jgi:hypothetical protein
MPEDELLAFDVGIGKAANSRGFADALADGCCGIGICCGAETCVPAVEGVTAVSALLLISCCLASLLSFGVVSNDTVF